MPYKKINPHDVKLVKDQLHMLNKKQNDEINDNAIDNPLFPY